jgi:hypothetical protein
LSEFTLFVAAMNVTSNGEDDDDRAARNAVFAALRRSPEDRFDLDCRALQANDPNTVHVDTRRLEGYGARLGQALVGNTQVQSFLLCLSKEAVNGPGNWEAESTDFLCDYMKKGPSLKGVIVHGANCLLLNRQFLQAVSYNSNIEQLILKTDNGYLEKFGLPTHEFAHLLRTTTSLKLLHMEMVYDAVVAKAFGANRTLETLQLEYDANKSPNGDIFCNLRLHPKLHSLTVGEHNSLGGRSISKFDTAAFDDGFVELLKDTKTLKHLILSWQSFDQARLLKLIKGLHVNNSLTHLSSGGCKFEEDAVEDWGDRVYWCGTLMRDAHANTSIQEVEITDSMLDPPTRDMEAALLVGMCRQCQVFKRRWCEDDTEAPVFWNTLEMEAATSVLREIWLDDYNMRTFDSAMLSCIPKYPNLQELHFNSLPSGDYYGKKLPEGFAHIVKRSGSLLKVTCNERPARSKDKVESKVIEASLERNRRLPQLLRLCVSVASCSDTETERQPVEDSDNGVVAVTKVIGPALPPLAELLAPTLSLAATQALNVGQSWLLKGLLELRRCNVTTGTSVSPPWEAKCGDKRTCADEALEVTKRSKKKRPKA